VRRWGGARPGEALERGAHAVLWTLAAFDVPVSAARRKLVELCKDFGLARAQWSVFEGRLSRGRREELFERGAALLKARGGGRWLVVPVGTREVQRALRMVLPGKDGGRDGASARQ